MSSYNWDNAEVDDDFVECGVCGEEYPRNLPWVIGTRVGGQRVPVCPECQNHIQHEGNDE